MKRILIASAVAFAAGGQALAADLPPPMAPPPRAPAIYVPVAPLYNWTGFYIGGNLGFGFTGGSFNSSAGTSVRRTTSTSFLGGGQVGVNYEFGGGVVIGAEAMFDWLPNTKNTVNIKQRSKRRKSRQRNDQQPLADDRDWQARLCLGSRAALRQGRWRLGRVPTPRAPRMGARRLAFRSYQQLRLDCGCRCGMGVRGQLVGARRVRLYRLDEPDLDVRDHPHCVDQLQQPQHPARHRRPELQVRRRLVVTARTYFLPRLGLPQAPGSTRGFFLYRNFLGTNMNLEPT